MRKADYDRYPSTKFKGFLVRGLDEARRVITERCAGIVAVDLYTGTFEDAILSELSACFDKVIDTRSPMKSEKELRDMTQPFMTDDVLFGFFVMGVCGGAVIPPLMGVLTDAIGTQAGSLIVITACALYLAFLAFRRRA